jgi:hypothetical protein
MIIGPIAAYYEPGRLFCQGQAVNWRNMLTRQNWKNNYFISKILLSPLKVKKTLFLDAFLKIGASAQHPIDGFFSDFLEQVVGPPKMPAAQKSARSR